MAQHNQLGKWGEEYAANYLLGKGYDILERDWRIGHRDIDIIARSPEGDTVVFVEVKTRTNDVVTDPRDAVDLRKIRSIGWAANAYVKQRNVIDLLRFDIISIVGSNDANANIMHVEDAFNPCCAFR